VPTFSDASYGFRPGRNAYQALRRARQYVASGKCWVVDIDLEKFFDRVNHDLLMSKLATKIGDARVLTLIRRGAVAKSDPVSGRAPQAHGEREQECGGAAVAA
jgi:RNA-directed DNA polymerase